MSDDLKLDKKIKHNIEIIIDRLQNKPTDGNYRTRLAEAVDQALAAAAGNIILSVESDTSPAARGPRSGDAPAYEDILLSAHYACTQCNQSYEPPTPQFVQFQQPAGHVPGLRWPGPTIHL